MNKDPITITREEFMSLKNGDIVLVKGRYIRTILEGPADRDGGKACVVSKIRRSQYHNGVTIYFYTEAKRVWKKLPMKNSKTLNKLEYQRLVEMGFDPCKEMRKQLFRTRHSDRRMGRKMFRPKIKEIV